MIQPIQPVNWRALRERYAAVTIALLLVIIVPVDLRQSLWRWALKGSDLVDVIAIFLVITNLRSMGEHRQSNKKIDGLHDKLDNGLKESIRRIERQLGIQDDA